MLRGACVPASWSRLLEAGVRIREYFRPIYNTKIVIVNSHCTMTEPTNFDERFFRLNDEASLNVYDHTYAGSPARRCLLIGRSVNLQVGTCPTPEE